MIQLSQYFQFGYFEILLIAFCIVSLVAFIKLIGRYANNFLLYLKSKRKDDTDDKINKLDYISPKRLPQFQSQFDKITSLITNKILPAVFGIFLFI